MTEAQFLFIHDNATGNINTPDTININIREDETDTDRGIITGLTVTVSDYDNEDLTTVLQQAEKVEITLEYFDGTTITEVNQSKITLNIISASKRNGFTGTNPYFYFRVEETVITPATAVGIDFRFVPSSNPNNVVNPNLSTVSFSPVLSEVKFLNDDYNPLISNASFNRRSNYIQVSDRNQLSANPTNIDSLLSQSADLAQIPDSNYSDTGLVNSRYVGSLTTAEDFGGIAPALTGGTFRGAIFSNQLTNAEIITAAGDGAAVIQDLFHTGPNTLPEFSVVTSSIRMTTALGSGTNVSYEAKAGSQSSGSMLFDVGNLLIIEDENVAEPNRETLRISSNNTIIRRFNLEREYGNSPKLINIGASDPVFNIVPTRIFRFNERGSGIIAADNVKVYLPENDLILDTDRFGVVFSGSVEIND